LKSVRIVDFYDRRSTPELLNNGTIFPEMDKMMNSKLFGIVLIMAAAASILGSFQNVMASAYAGQVIGSTRADIDIAEADNATMMTNQTLMEI
jgi:hypothetical protein